MARLSVPLLGTFQATLDGEPVTVVESDKVRALLAYLAVESERAHRREKLVEELFAIEAIDILSPIPLIPALNLLVASAQ